MTNQNYTGALSWDSEISQESSFTLLPEGTYKFTIEKMERSQYTPSPHSSIRDVSPMAELTLRIASPEHGETSIKENLILHTKMEWKISELLLAIGQKKKGEPTQPNWSQIPMSEGWAEVEVNEYTNKDGQDRKNNRVKRFIPLDEAPQQQQPTYQQQATQPQTNNQQQTQNQQNQGFAF